jgi:type IV pilus assembly protein PilB
VPEFIRKQIGEKLIEQGFITLEQYEAGMQKHIQTQVPLRQVLIDMGFISEDRLMEFLGVSIGIPFFRDIPNKVTDPEALKAMPEKICRQYFAIPLFKSNGILTIAMSDPLDVFAIDDLQNIAQCKVDAVMGKREEIIKAIDKFYGAQGAIAEIVQGIEKDEQDSGQGFEIIPEAEITDQEPEPAETEVVDAPIIRLVNTIITQAIKERVSDIHIEPEERKLGIRYRIDGILREAMVPPKRLQASITSRIKIMAGMDIAIKRTPQDGRFKIRVEEKNIDVRISTVPTIYGEKVVMRLLDQTNVRKGLAKAGFSADKLKQFQELITRPYGIILVTGPTGSGKTTTLYLALQTIHSPERNIITIEEPVEYEIVGISQIAVNVKAGVTFAQGLKSILRQDPDVIMIGEIRDLETANIAVRAALTGHLVFSTLHTNDAAGSISRLIDMGVPPYLVTSSVCGVLAQRLVRMICPRCKEPYQPDPKLLKEAGLDTEPDKIFYHGRGCEECGHTGYQGRAGIFELMILDKQLRAVIHAGESQDTIRLTAQQAGMKSLWEDGKEKIIQGLTTIEELKRVTFME